MKTKMKNLKVTMKISKKKKKKNSKGQKQIRKLKNNIITTITKQKISPHCFQIQGEEEEGGVGQ